jgi:2-polyprenyl-6-methoxyphenol hydroxylase-like FAD-dependent oxidoreductase
LLTSAGARVLVVDRGTLGSDTLSTSYLMRGAVTQLQRWGILPKLIAAGTPPVRVTHFHYATHSIAVEIRPGQGVDALFAPRRTVLDPLLVAAASQAGAEIRFGVRVEGLLRDESGRVRGVELARGHSQRESLTAGVVIGADGIRSSVARWVDAATYRVGQSGSSTIYGYFEGMPALRRPTTGCPRSSWAPRLTLCPRCTAIAAPACCASQRCSHRSWQRRSPTPAPGQHCARFQACPATIARPTDQAGRWSATRVTSAIPTPRTASATHCATPSCSRTRS